MHYLEKIIYQFIYKLNFIGLSNKSKKEVSCIHIIKQTAIDNKNSWCLQ